MTNRKLVALILVVAVAMAILTGAATYAFFTDTETVDVHVSGNVQAAAIQPTTLVDAESLGLQTGAESTAPSPEAPEQFPSAYKLPAISPIHASAATQFEYPLQGVGG